ncbi:MAG TPA: vWA domain-containing protein [Polyangiaceae bacterium]|nr:vWA domain-containing protein [Polyangiaceae bacterium]
MPSFAAVPCPNGNECGTGTYCGPEKTCRADCSEYLPCPSGQACSADGRCIVPTGTGQAPPGGGGAPGTSGGGIILGGSNSGGNAGAATCATSQVEFEKQTPNVMLVVDRSLSMNTPFGAGGQERWNVVRDALIDPTTGIVTQLQAEVRFGLTLYTGPANFGGGFGPGLPPGGGFGGSGGAGGASGTAGSGSGAAMCPNLIEVPVALNNLQAMSAVYLPDDWEGSTPTGQSLDVVWPKLRDLDPVTFPGPKVIVLATDGEPNTCTSVNAMQEGRQRSVEAIRAAFDAGIQTFVISVGNQVGEDHLHEIANLGQGFPANDPMDRYYPANDPAQLTEAFDIIINGVRSCTFDLNGTVNPSAADQGRVTVDGTQLPYNDPDGWRLNGANQVVVQGAGCQLIQSGAQGIDIWFPCGVYVPE